MTRKEFEQNLTEEQRIRLANLRGGRPAVTLEQGCPGCRREWNVYGKAAEERGYKSEGQCSRCKRCLDCCGKEIVHGSCGQKEKQLKHSNIGKYIRSKKAYDRWLTNENILGHNRRIN